MDFVQLNINRYKTLLEKEKTADQGLIRIFAGDHKVIYSSCNKPELREFKKIFKVINKSLRAERAFKNQPKVASKALQIINQIKEDKQDLVNRLCKFIDLFYSTIEHSFSQEDLLDLYDKLTDLVIKAGVNDCSQFPNYCEKLEQEIKKEAHKIPAKTFWQRFKFNK